MSSFGEELARERELRQITLREVAEATKINLRYLEALEQNDFKHLPGGIFNRGFVKAYAQYIGIDADAMVNAYLAEEQAQDLVAVPGEGALLRGRKSGLLTSTEQSTDRPWSISGVLPIWLLALVGIVILILAVWLFYPDSADEAQGLQENSATEESGASLPEGSLDDAPRQVEEEQSSEESGADDRGDGS